jgi:hypothetical protein
VPEPRGPTVADIFRDGFPAYVQVHGPLPGEHYKAADAIRGCRTARMGGHVYACDACGHEHITYNSCRNRHCPQCQALARAHWVQKRMEELLPVPYFHVVFTIPAELNPFALRNKRAVYAILFHAVSETLLELARNKKHLGASIGFIAVLHTWGQNLMDHPHVHCVVPGGGIKNGAWVHGKGGFLFPVQVMGALFRGKFMAYFKKAVADRTIGFHGALAAYQNQGAYQNLLDALYATDWIVYAKPPFAGPQAVLKYLGSYTHRIAISNRRIRALEEGRVSFSWRSYADGNAVKTMTLTVPEFIRRFFLHVLPTGFRRIRYYGFLGNRARKTMLPLCRQALGAPAPETGKNEPPQTWVELCIQLTGTDPTICPICKTGRLKPAREISRAPPETTITYAA